MDGEVIVNNSGRVKVKNLKELFLGDKRIRNNKIKRRDGDTFNSGGHDDTTLIH